MNHFPIIARELRVESRRWTTYWLRLLAATAVICGVLFSLAAGNSSPRAGSEMFAQMHTIVLAAIWVLVPLMTCDCLSREKREGTLGLLFLTNLRASEIVLAKAMAHGLRAFGLWLAVVPIVGIPWLMGGLTWQELFFSCGLAFISICVALAAGLLASALARRVNGAVGWAVVLASLACCAFPYLTLLFLASFAFGINTITSRELTEVFSGMGALISFAVIWNGEDVWSHVFNPGNAKATRAILIGTALLVLLTGLLLFLFSTLVIAPILRRNWQDRPKSKRQQDAENIFCRPVLWIGIFRRWMRRSLEKNPIGWLEKRSWQGRMTSWVWLAVMASFSTVLVYEAGSSYRSYIKGFDMLMWLLLGTIAWVTAGSFRRERETGALELILITPLSERQIISGRLRGLWSQFLPAFAIWLAIVLYLSSALDRWPNSDFAFWIVSYFTLPVIGLYFSLRSRFVLLSWLATLVACFAFPPLVSWIFHWILMGNYTPRHVLPWPMFISAVQVILALILLQRLHIDLRRRSFWFH